MEKVKKFFGKIFIVICASLVVASVAQAATTSVDVGISIEAPERVITETGETEYTNRSMESVQTGDWVSMGAYILGTIAAVVVAGVCLWRRKKNKVFMFLATLVITMVCIGFTSKAAEETKNVNVTIPTSISILFEQAGTTSTSEFEVKNQSLVPITIEKIQATECNDWKLTITSEAIPVNTKKLAFSLGGQNLQSGENVMGILIPEGTDKELEIEVDRGAWTENLASETALNLEVEYSIGVKEFQIMLDANGGSVNSATLKACNGDTVTLPNATKEKYVFKGWEDEEGNVYEAEYVMPIGDVSLTAVWAETQAYAVYSEDDGYLVFCRSDIPIQEGDVHDGRNVTKVFTDLEDSIYTELSLPWYSIRADITQVRFDDIVSPVSTNFWFYHFDNAVSADVTKLDMSRATSMRYMFSYFGRYLPEVTCNGIEDWDMSNMKDMFFAFYYYAARAQTAYLGDLSKWDVSNATNMCRMFSGIAICATNLYFVGIESWDVSSVTNMNLMFYDAGKNAVGWYLDLSGWDVRNVILYEDFNYHVEHKVIAPNWPD